jgi:hypothetical protein
MGEQPNGRNRLHRLSQAHFIGQHGPMSGIQESDAV